jgi:dienelactone hydrolase
VTVVLVLAQLAVGLGLVCVAWLSDLAWAAWLVGLVLAIAVSVGLVALTLDPRALPRAVACLTGGIVGTCVGGGLGPAWLATSGLSVIGAIELVALLAGLLLLGVGTWTLLRAISGWWRLIAIPIGFLILQFVVVPAAGAVYGTHPPRTSAEAAMPAAATTVSLETADGVPLIGWYTPSRDGAAIVLLPGSGGTKGSTIDHASALAEHGYGVLALDSRGTGDSGGVAHAWGWKGDQDVAAAIAWLSERPDVDPTRIGLLGLSMGGEIALTAAAARPGIAAVVAEGVSARVPADLAYLPSDLTGFIHRVDAGIMWGLAALLADATPPPPLTEVVAAIDVPTLVIVGSAADEAAAAPLLQDAAPDLGVWEVDAPHTGALSHAPDDWQTRVIGFLDEALAR